MLAAALTAACAPATTPPRNVDNGLAKLFGIEGSLPRTYAASRKPERSLTEQDIARQRESFEGTHYSPAACWRAARVNTEPAGTKVAGVWAVSAEEHSRIEFTASQTREPLAGRSQSDEPQCRAVAFAGRTADWPDVSGVTTVIDAPHIDGVQTYARQTFLTIHDQEQQATLVQYLYLAELDEHHTVMTVFITEDDGKANSLTRNDAADLFVKATQLMHV
ncbi:DUF5642 family protein [Mycolicibacterium mucogenicum]|uniref:DUF5642 family protein n=1 Tax=Mycolicibacterium mucogenicum TaxID=56689 RepID=UPI001CDD8290|nr:DUF5642 family protein [Mycolicibacterium mucogenicum]